jgi:hypothetical protein
VGDGWLQPRIFRFFQRIERVPVCLVNVLLVFCIDFEFRARIIKYW